MALGGFVPDALDCATDVLARIGIFIDIDAQFARGSCQNVNACMQLEHLMDILLDKSRRNSRRRQNVDYDHI